MNHFEHLKRLNRIEPDPAYAERSRRLIISAPQKLRVSIWDNFMNSLRSGSAVAVAVLALVILGGGYSMMRYLKTTGGLDRGALSAEAQAIDMQIELADIKYSSLPFADNHAKKPAHPAKSADATSTAPTATSTPGMTLDDALNALSQ